MPRRGPDPDVTLGHLDVLQVLCEDEIARRESGSLTRRIRRARFEETINLRTFIFNRQHQNAPSIAGSTCRTALAVRRRIVILYGPVGVGKTLWHKHSYTP